MGPHLFCLPPLLTNKKMYVGVICYIVTTTQEVIMVVSNVKLKGNLGKLGKTLSNLKKLKKLRAKKTSET